MNIVRYIFAVGLPLFLYIFIYVLMVLLKPTFLIEEIGVNEWYCNVMSPLILIDARLNYAGPVDGVCEVEESIAERDYIFLRQNGKTFRTIVAPGNGVLKAKLDRTPITTKLNINFQKNLQINEDFRPYLSFWIKSVN